MSSVIGGKYSDLFEHDPPKRSRNRSVRSDSSREPTAFIVRVVLSGAESDDYRELHRLMEEAGFSRQIKAKTGNVYKLPDAEYLAVTRFSPEQVLQRARRTATQTGEEVRLLVSEVDSFRWDNLEEIHR